MERAGSAELTPSKRIAEDFSGKLPREDKATAMRVLSLSGKPSAARSRPAFYIDPKSFRLASLPSRPLGG
jgi:hypothetical protein